MKTRAAAFLNSRAISRSEERRVGKECRSWWWPYHYKKKTLDSSSIFLCCNCRVLILKTAQINTNTRSKRTDKNHHVIHQGGFITIRMQMPSSFHTPSLF